MNPNYIAPEALADGVTPPCLQCGRSVQGTEEKIKFYQGVCPCCGRPPGVMADKANKPSKPPRRMMSTGMISFQPWRPDEEL